MFKIMHILEGTAVLLGLIILGAVFLNFSVAEAAALPELLSGHSGHPLIGFAGFTLATLPITRRLGVHLLLNGNNISEFHEMTAAMHRIGLLHRIQAVNLYLAGLPDASWSNVFASQEDLWNWLGEAYQDDALRRQMHPDVVRRTAQAQRAIQQFAVAA